MFSSDIVPERTTTKDRERTMARCVCGPGGSLFGILLSGFVTFARADPVSLYTLGSFELERGGRPIFLERRPPLRERSYFVNDNIFTLGSLRKFSIYYGILCKRSFS